MELGTFEWRLISVVVFVFVCYIIAFPIRRSRACTYVLKKKSDLAEQLAEARRLLAVSSNVGSGTNKALANLEQDFRRFVLLNAFRDADWVAERKAIDEFEAALKRYVAGISATKSK